MKFMNMPVTIGTIGIATRVLKKNLEAISGKNSINSLQKRGVLGTSRVIQEVLQPASLSLSDGDHRWFKRSIRKKRPVIRENEIIIT
jgi:hypothetical protein